MYARKEDRKAREGEKHEKSWLVMFSKGLQEITVYKLTGGACLDRAEVTIREETPAVSSRWGSLFEQWWTSCR
jgi:hypothetical protein